MVDLSRFVRLSIQEATDELVKVVPSLDPFRAKRSIVELISFVWSYNYLCTKKMHTLFDSLVGYKCGEFVLPFILSKDYFSDSMCLVGPYSEHYAVNRRYKELIGDEYKPIVQSETEVAKFPLLKRPEEPDFRAFIMNRRKDYASMFFGAKSKRISYRLVKYGTEEYNRVIYDVLDIYLKHNQKYYDKLGNESETVVNAEIAGAPCMWDKPYMEGSWLIAAYDEDLHKYVCAMNITLIDDVVQCGTIAPNQDPMYKPYSLVICSQYVMVREVFYSNNPEFENVNYIDFGINFEDVAGYKRSFTDEFSPMCNFDVLTPEESDYLFNLGA